MKVNYKVFMKHAEKVAKGVSEARPILRGVEHRDDGTLTITDSYRLYRAYNVNAPRGVVIDAITGEEIDGNYPQTDRLIPSADDAAARLAASDIKALIGVLKAAENAARAVGINKKNVHLELRENRLHLADVEEFGLSFEFSLEGDNERLQPIFRLSFLVEAAEMFADMGAKRIALHLYDTNRPILLTSDDQPNVVALILPVRRALK